MRLAVEKMNRIKKIGAFSLIYVIVISFFLLPLNPNFLNYNYEHPTKQSEFPRSSAETVYSQEWLDNNDFSTQDEWFYSKGELGDNSTVDASISGENANFKVIGEELIKEISSPLNDGTWVQFRNDIFLYPDTATINADGCYVDHQYDESINQTRNYHSVHWKKNVSMGSDMSKNIINSASLEVIFNATVNVNVDVENDNISPQFGIGDFATFYVLISDLDFTNPYRVANNKTSTLGQDSPSITTITDKPIETVDEEDIITALSSSLDKDPEHSNFTITLGIDIYCEDNFGTDYDYWDALLIKSLNLTFSYERKVEKFSSVSWNQIGNQISGANFQITQANLKFQVKINQSWPTSLSPFSEVRILINNNPHFETIRLSSVNGTLQDAKTGGFDVSNLILKDVNISLSIQVFIANTFGLSSNITFSIDNVYLNITYIDTFADYETESQLFLENANKTADPFIQIPLENTVNITIKYLDNETNHIAGAIVQLSGKVSDQLTENGPLGQYSTVIDSTDLEIGIWSLTVTAEKSNYETQVIPFFVDVVERITDLQLYVNGTLKTNNNTVNIKFNEVMNITIFYRDNLTNQHLSGANVTIRNYGDLTENNEQYTININSNSLNLGFNVLTINSQSENYTSQSLQLYVEVYDRATDFKLLVNATEKVENDLIQVQVGEILNLTIFYKDIVDQYHLSGAIVKLVGVGNFNETGFQYNYTLDSRDLNIGFNILSISTQLDNYESQSIQIYIEVYNTPSELTLLVENNSTSPNEIVQVEVDEFINITVFYKDNETKQYLTGATVELIGWGNFSEIGTQYNYTIDTNNLNQGINVLTITAYLDEYQSQNIQFYFEIIGKATELKLYVEDIEQSEKDTVQANINQLLNFTIIYHENLTKQHLSGASVNFIGLGTFADIGTQYYYNLNTTDLGLGFNAITISAQLDNYQFQSIQIYIEVVEKATELKLFVEGEEKVEKDTIQIEFNQLLNLTIFYNDNSSKVHLSGANVTLIGVGNFNDIGTQYYYNLNSTDLGLGFNVITIFVQLDDFQSQSIQIYVDVYEIPTELQLFLNGDPKSARDTLEVEVNEFINITIFYRQNSTGQFLNNATVELLGWGNFSEIGAQYNFTINTNDLEQGITILTINAQYTNHLSLSIQFYIKVTERATEFRLYVEGALINETDTLSVEVNQFLNLTVFYQDNLTNQHLSGAAITVSGVGNFSDVGGQYYYLLNTNDLEQGITILTVFVYLENYQPRFFQFYVKVSERASEISLFLNSEEKTTDPVYELPFGSILNITVKYSDNQTKTHIPGGNIQLIDDTYSDNLTEYLAMNQYTLILDTTVLKIGVNLFTIIAYANNFQVKTITLRITLNKIATVINTTSGDSYFEKEHGQSIILSIVLTDSDFGGTITNATVTYRWAYGQGTLSDLGNNGTYAFELENIQTGTYTITITASAGDDYSFETYKITLNVVSVPPDDFSLLFITLAGALIALVVGFTLYEVRFKYPPTVRKSRKIRKKIRKSKKTKPVKDIMSREELIKDRLESNAEIIQLEKKTENGFKKIKIS